MDDTQWDEAFSLGTMSAVRSIRVSLPLLRGADWARIVTLSAHSIQRQNPRIVAYTASKAALASVTKNLSKSLAKDGILVNCVCPGTIVTASFTENLKDILATDGLDATDPVDVMTWIDNNFHQPCDLGRAGLPKRSPPSPPTWHRGEMATSPARRSTWTAARTSSEVECASRTDAKAPDTPWK